jgi:hypothetical protein
LAESAVIAQVVIYALGAADNFRTGSGGYCIFIGCEWAVAALAWFAISLFAEYEKRIDDAETYGMLLKAHDTLNKVHCSIQFVIMQAVDNLAKNTAAKLNMEKNELLDSRLSIEVVRQLLNEAEELTADLAKTEPPKNKEPDEPKA